MRIEVNSDHTVSVDARVKSFVRGEVERILDARADKLTRVEVHLSDVNSSKSGPADKRCLVEARPAGARPLSTSATAASVPVAVAQALKKMKRALSTFFGKHARTPLGRATASPAAARTSAASSEPSSTGTTSSRKTAASKTAKAAAPAAKKTTPRKAAKKTAKQAAKKAATRSVKKTVVAATEPDGPRASKKAIFLARRKAWPTR